MSNLNPISGVSSAEVFLDCQQQHLRRRKKKKKGGRWLKPCTFHMLWSFCVLESCLRSFTEGHDESMDKFQGIDKLPEMYTTFMPIYLFLLFSISHLFLYSLLRQRAFTLKFISAYFSIVLITKTLYILIQSILSTILKGRYYYYSHLREKKTIQLHR